MLLISHLKLAARDVREVVRFRRACESAKAGTRVDVAIHHEADGSCCELEDWLATEKALSGDSIVVNYFWPGGVTPEDVEQIITPGDGVGLPD